MPKIKKTPKEKKQKKEKIPKEPKENKNSSIVCLRQTSTVGTTGTKACWRECKTLC
jgi:hypothetical protein